MSQADRLEPRQPREEYVTAKEIAARLGITRRTLRRWVSLGSWPRPVELNSRVKRWPASLVEERLREAMIAGSAA